MKRTHVFLGKAACTVLMGLLLNSCGGKPALTLRTDLEPLTKRLNLPKQVQSARWVAVSPVNDTGSVPGRTDFFEVYAYLPMDEGGWAALTPGAARDAITIPEAAAKAILPASAGADFTAVEGGRRAEGPAFDATTLIAAGETKTRVEKAIHVGPALVVQMRVH